jgi:hypothetical protein
MVLKVWRGRPRPRDGVQWQLRRGTRGLVRSAPDFRLGLSRR